MINVLFVHSSSELYGSDRSLLNIVRYIDKTKYHPHVMLPCEGPLAVEMNKIPGIEVHIYSVAVLRRKNMSFNGMTQYYRDYKRSVNYIKKYIQDNNITIVDTNTAVVIPGAVAAKRSNVKSVWHIREIIKNRAENKVISYVMNKYSDLIVANSKSTGQALGVPQKKIRVVYNAVEYPEIINKKEHQGINIGMAGRINRWKGQRLFVDAATIVCKRHPDAFFFIAGDVYQGEDEIKKDLITYIDNHKMQKHVKLVGLISDMNEFYDSLDIFVLPSIQPEPFGLVVIEAMGHELPVIATNHGGPTEIIKDKKEGFLVEYKDAREMASRINQLIEEPRLREQMAKNALASRKNNFSVKKMVENIENVFEEVLEK